MTGKVYYCRSCFRAAPPRVAAKNKSLCSECKKPLSAAEDYLFISYAGEDLKLAARMAKALWAQNVGSWIADEQIGPSQDHRAEISVELNRAKAVVLLLTKAATNSPYVADEIEFAKRRPDGKIFVFQIGKFEVPDAWELRIVSLSRKRLSAWPTETELKAAAVWVQSFGLDARTIAGKEEPLATGGAPGQGLQGVTPALSPYAGPRAFSSRMKDLFWGREQEAAELCEEIKNHRIVLLHAPSGAGKTSLLNTLVAERLGESGFELFYGARVGGALPEGMKHSEIRNIFTYGAIRGLEPEDSRIPGEVSFSGYLKWKLASGGRKPRLLVLDQFEELFTRYPERFKDKREFRDDLMAAMRTQDGLHALFAIREEYLAQTQELLSGCTGEFESAHFSLPRMNRSQILAAVTGPANKFAVFAPGIAEKIVEQVFTIIVRNPPEPPYPAQAEFIEAVHLQIVCDRLWRLLDPGITCIEEAHVRKAMGAGADGENFVVNALDGFYDSVVNDVAATEEQSGGGCFTRDQIILGCAGFVTLVSGIWVRTMLQCKNGRIGRLPRRIVERLEERHLLRCEVHGGEQWYELSHDLLAASVGRRKSAPRANSALHAADLLEKVMEPVRCSDVFNRDAEVGLKFPGHFQEHHGILGECEALQDAEILFEDEAEFLFRASIAGGQDMRRWSERLGRNKAFDKLKGNVLAEALRSEPPEIRQNGVVMLGFEPLTSLAQELVQIALFDEDRFSRRTAAKSIAQLDEAGLYDQLVAPISGVCSRGKSLRALAQIQVALDAPPDDADADAPLPQAREFWRFVKGRLSLPMRAGMFLYVRLIRVLGGFFNLFFSAIIATVFAVLAAAPAKAFFGAFNWALCQSNANPFRGLFQGGIGAVYWGATICCGLAFHGILRSPGRGKASYPRPYGALVFGGLFGLAGSVINLLIISTVFEMSSLLMMGWISNAEERRLGPEFMSDLFFRIRFGWTYLLLGLGLGVGMALMMNRLSSSPNWTKYLRTYDKPFTWRTIADLTKIALRSARPLAVCVALAAIVAFPIPKTVPNATPEGLRTAGYNVATAESVPAGKPQMLTAAQLDNLRFKVSATGVLKGLIGDCVPQMIGGFFAIVGLGLGSLMMGRGRWPERSRGRG